MVAPKNNFPTLIRAFWQGCGGGDGGARYAALRYLESPSGGWMGSASDIFPPPSTLVEGCLAAVDAAEAEDCGYDSRNHWWWGTPKPSAIPEGEDHAGALLHWHTCTGGSITTLWEDRLVCHWDTHGKYSHDESDYGTFVVWEGVDPDAWDTAPKLFWEGSVPPGGSGGDIWASLKGSVASWEDRVVDIQKERAGVIVEMAAARLTPRKLALLWEQKSW